MPTTDKELKALVTYEQHSKNFKNRQENHKKTTVIKRLKMPQIIADFFECIEIEKQFKDLSKSW